MRAINQRWILIVVLSVLLFSCKKDSESSAGSGSGSGSGSGGGNSGSGSNSSTTTARYMQNATVEDYTGLNCGYCPRAHTYLEKAKTTYGDKVVGIEIHGTAYEDQGSTFTYKPADNLGTVMQVTGFPTVHINRTINSSTVDPTSEIGPHITGSSVSSTVGLLISSNLSGSNLSITVKSRFSTATTGSKLVVYVLESGVDGNQHSYYNDDSTSPYYRQGAILTYKHDGVLRTSASNILGDGIPSQTAGSEYVRTYAVTLNPSWNTSNLSIAAMVVQSDNTLINAQQANVGQTKDFQILVP